MSENYPFQINGWSIFAHSLFLTQLEELLGRVEDLRQKFPDTYKKKNDFKRLAAIAKLAFQDIPQDPTDSKYRQGKTLGTDYKHWFRAKFFQQYRLFFQYRQAEDSKIIIFAWVNDEKTKRTYGSKTDAYQVFKKMIDNGNPPNNWDELMKNAREESDRLEQLSQEITKLQDEKDEP